MKKKYLEPQYGVLDDYQSRYGLVELGPMSSFTYNDDPKRLSFLLSRYKFVGKMFNGFGNVLEIGCGDAFGSRLVRQHVTRMTVTDMDSRMVRFVSSRSTPAGYNLQAQVWNPMTEANPFNENFDGVFALDVLEHVSKETENDFITSIIQPLGETGTLILGMPSFESQVYASPASKAGHINCKTQEELVKLGQVYFDYVFTFGMNDEVVHTGFSRMANYIFILCSRKKDKPGREEWVCN